MSRSCFSGSGRVAAASVLQTAAGLLCGQQRDELPRPGGQPRMGGQGSPCA